MQPMYETVNRALRWVRHQSNTHMFELVDGRNVVAQLIWINNNENLVEVKAVQEHWTFKCTGFWKPRIMLHSIDSESHSATFEPDWSGGAYYRLPAMVSINGNLRIPSRTSGPGRVVQASV